MTTHAQHTPGPWAFGVARNGRRYVFDSDGKPVCGRFVGSDGDISVAEANARLIAAAPALLAAAKAARPILNRLREDEVAGFGDCWEVLDQIDDAIAAAEQKEA